MRYQYDTSFSSTEGKKPVSERFAGILSTFQDSVGTGQVFTPTPSSAVDQAKDRFGGAAEQFKADARAAVDRGFEDFRRTSDETINSYTSAIDAVQERNRRKAASRGAGTRGLLGAGLQLVGMVPGVGSMVGQAGKVLSGINV